MQVFEHPPSCSVQAVLVLLAFAWEIAPSHSLSSSLHRSPPHPSWPTCWPPRLCTAGTCSRCSCTFQKRIEKWEYKCLSSSYVKGNWQALPVTVRQGRKLKLVHAEKDICLRGSPGNDQDEIDCQERQPRRRTNLGTGTLLAIGHRTAPHLQSRIWHPAKKRIYCFSFIKPVRIIPELQKHVLRMVWVSYYIVEVTVAVSMTNGIWLFVGSPS